MSGGVDILYFVFRDCYHCLFHKGILVIHCPNVITFFQVQQAHGRQTHQQAERRQIDVNRNKRNRIDVNRSEKRQIDVNRSERRQIYVNRI